MTSRFRNFIPFVLKWEGTVYENDPDDPGGETKYGIDKRSHENVDIPNLTQDEAEEIYFKEYWTRNRCETLALKLGESHFDACVNCGGGRAGKFLKAAKFDPYKYNDERDAFYHRLVAARPRSKKYLKGWLNRTADLRDFLHLS